jgi:signal transduction histidine kinase
MPFIPLLKDQIFNRGGSSYIITNIEKETIPAVKDLTAADAEIKHIDLLALRRSVIYDDKVAHFSIIEPVITHSATESVDQTEREDLWVGSTEQTVVQSAKNHFLSDWEKAIPAIQRIREVEEGIILGTTQVIQAPPRILKLFIKLVKQAKEEVLLVLPTINAFYREERLGIILLLKEAALDHNINVRILTPTNDDIERKISNMTELKQLQKLNIRPIEMITEATVTTVTIMVVDRKESLAIEKIDDSKDDFLEATGPATYSNSEPTVLSYLSIFESLWQQTELYMQLKDTNRQLEHANEEVKLHSKMQNEFINVAAHELRTPIQPILSSSDVLMHKITKPNEFELVNIITRNAKRLQQLAENILDVTKIESKSLVLKKELINLNELLLNTVADSKNQIIRERKDNCLILQLINSKEDIFVEADRGRINQVILNLLSNAIKFTNKGSINISVYKHQSNEVVVSIKDTGSGLDPEILPRLFSKFATKSITGTGLGLFISKSIIEAHGGRIWAENNKDAKGTTFTFSLPLSEAKKEAIVQVN